VSAREERDDKVDDGREEVDKGECATTGVAERMDGRAVSAKEEAREGDGEGNSPSLSDGCPHP
jgi:hypothetical protein